ncbi:hypothetical protein AMATHDRAFT_59149 [Amanita thiersii Skay4041]|uniref:non-specific serine/threonine protein kinase n=1 Tax=Amanita thiersii Skay4041 TaxID=703135 RepID=A0A2A9NUF5_9AGAR|nr:hypothetical protein AMATHDRAFT_59149 [Amanita thiersii Skay4041]
MSDSGSSRRQPPSPLVFTPESVLSPSNPPANVSTSNTVSMPFVRRHVTRRLKAAKADCDKELQRVTNNITTFFEERLREADLETDKEYKDRERGRDRDRDRERDRDGRQSDVDPPRDVFAYQHPESVVHSHTEDYYSDGGYEAEVEYGRHSRHPSASSQMSPISTRRGNPLPWDKPLSTSVSSSAVGSSPASSVVMLPDVPITRKQTNTTTPASSSWGSAPSRRLSRTIHIPIRPTRSGASSRSTSRSRSPLPPLSTHASFSDLAPSGPSTSNRRSSRILIDDPIDPIMSTLYALIAVATDVIDMSVAQLTAQPKICESIVQRVQNIGKAWDEHPEWHGRNWYVQILLAVASLSRVVEWWEAEKQFWNFDDNNAEQDEPLTFVTKPVSDDLGIRSPSDRHEAELEDFRLNDEDEISQRSVRQTGVAPSNREAYKIISSPSSLPPVPQESHSRAASYKQPSESARVLATERLRLQAETAQNQNIVMELSLDGDHLIWINHAWRSVVGTDPDVLSGTRISNLLASSDSSVFKEATHRLKEDDSRTVEVRFRLQIESNIERDPSAGTLYQSMEGKGMLMIDREDGQPSHTMWVAKPIAPPRYEYDSPTILLEADDLGPEPASSLLEVPFSNRQQSEPVTPFPFNEPISTEPILCRICECQIPQWYFEKHSDTCAETHRLEAEILECNESIAELRNTIRDLCTAVDRSSPVTVPEYRGMPILSTSPIISSPLQLFRANNKLQRFGAKKAQRRLLERLEDILQVAAEVAVPSMKEDEAKEPIERQRLLSPGSERKISQVRNWSKPSTDDSALAQLVQDAERVMRQKVDSVIRMQNTIRYAEKIWHEWEERVGEALANAGESDGSDESTSEGEEPDSAESIKLKVNEGAILEYTQAIPISPDPTPIPSTSPVPSSRSPDSRGSVTSSQPQSASLPTYSSRQQLHTRSSTPSSVSSPLALAAPIVAPNSPDLEDNVPHINLDDISASITTVNNRRSAQNLLEPKVVVTPPASPQVVPKDGASLTRESSVVKRRHRRHSTVNPVVSPSGPLSPRQPSSAPLSRMTPTSIKDFDIIKPISKGAFGSVFLAKKKITGDYYAIKVLKKADMIAKNQITNVKAERMILMKQAESPFVAKLYFTFQSRDNLYLVMEYLNGGDCAALIKSLGSLPEEWTRQYVAEVVLGLEYLHQRGIVHRDLKPDNLLINQHGHLKLTDFGLSRIGLLGRQTRDGQLGRLHTRYNSRSRPPSMDSAYLASPIIFSESTSSTTPGSYFSHRTNSVSRVGNSSHFPFTDDVSESSGSESLSGFGRRSGRTSESPLQSFATELTTDLRSHSNSGGNTTPPGEQKFVGTPDYLAPETILGLRGDDVAVDWWALGVITYEFLYGIPPFHAETPGQVFENILSGHVEWHEDWVDFSQESRDFIKALLTLDPSQRLGSNGSNEVKTHPFFTGVDWDKVTTTEAAFIPQVTDPESTDYFDPRGAIPQLFHDDDQIAITGQMGTDSPDCNTNTNMPPPALPMPTSTSRDNTASPSTDDFGSFSFKNFPVLKQANDDVIRKLKTDQMTPLTHALSEPGGLHQRKRSVSQRIKKPPTVVTNMDAKLMTTNPPSPATSTSSIASSPSRMSLPPPTPGVPGHVRKPSEFGAIERFKHNYLEGDRRNSMPSRLRTSSVSSVGDGSGSEQWGSSIGHGSQPETHTPPSSVHSIDLKKVPDPNDRAVTCLLAEDNPITAKIIETLLIRLGCRCVVVSDGSEAISVAMGEIKFDCILMDLHMPVLDGGSAARYIRSTNGKNASTPIVAVSAYGGADPSDADNLFAASLSKPLQKADLLTVMKQLGFKTSTMQGRRTSKVTAPRGHS